MSDPFLPKTRIAPQFGGPGAATVIPAETPETSLGNFRISDWWQTTSANAASTWLSSAFSMAPDPAFRWQSDEEFTKFAADIPPQAWPDLYNATSRRQAEFLRSEYLKVQQAKERMASAGFAGQMLNSGLSFVDPVNIVALAVPLGRAATVMRQMTRAGRLSMLAGEGLLGGAVNLAAESIRSTYDPTFDRSALATAFASGAAAGITGPLGTNLSRGGRFALTGGGQFAAVGGVGIASGQSVGDAASAAAMAMIVGGSLAALPPTVRSQIEARLSEVPLVAAGDDARAAGLPLTPEGEQRTAFKPGKVEPEVVATQEAATPVPPPLEVPAASGSSDAFKSRSLQFLRALEENAENAPNIQELTGQLLDVAEFRQSLLQAIGILDGDPVAVSSFESLKKRAAEMPGGWQEKEVNAIQSLLDTANRWSESQQPAAATLTALPPALDQTQPTLFDAYSDSPPAPPPPPSDGPAVAVVDAGDADVQNIRLFVERALYDNRPKIDAANQPLKQQQAEIVDYVDPSTGISVLLSINDGTATVENLVPPRRNRSYKPGASELRRIAQDVRRAYPQIKRFDGERSTGANSVNSIARTLEDWRRRGIGATATPGERSAPAETPNRQAQTDSSAPTPPSDGPAVAVGATTPGQTTSTVDRAVEPGDFVATEMRAAAPARPLNAPRWDFAYQVGSSLVEDVRELGTMLFSDSLVRADGTANMSSAADSWVRQNVQKREIAHARAMDEAFDGWAKDQMAAGRSRVDLMMRGRREFNQQVARAKRRGVNGVFSSDPHINKAAAAVAREKEELRLLQQRHLVPGMENVGPNDSYLSRVYNLTRTIEAIRVHGMDYVVQLVRTAMERDMLANRLQPSQLPPIDPKILDIAAAGMVERMVAGKLGFESVGGVVQMPSDMSGVLAQILRSKNVPEDTITATLARLVNQESEAGRIDSARSRVALDETTEIVTPAGRLSIEDILENDVDVLMTVYRQKALGASAMSEIFRSFRAKGYDEVFTFDGLLGRIRSEAQKKALQPGADMLAISRDLEANIDRLTLGYRHVMGEQLFPPSSRLRGRVDDVLALARQASYGVVMNVNGFAQIADSFKFLAPENAKALRKQVPQLDSLLSMARAGKLPSETVRELEYHFGVGAEAVSERMINRFDDDAASNQLAGGRVESAMRNIGRVTSWIGFSRPINLFNQRMAALTAMQRIGDAVLPVKTYTHSGTTVMIGKPDELFARMGIGNRDMAERIANQIRTHGKAGANNAIEHLGLDKWDDYEAYAAFQSAFDRMRREINQENDFGNSTLWMQTPIGKTIMQFRTFANVAYQKATLRGAQRFLNGEGWEQAGTMLVNSIGGLLGYVALTYVNSLGREDRDEFLRERLSSNALATAMFARSQWSSLFPLAADTVGFHVWGQQPFAPARNSGLQGHILFGNPTLSLVAGASNAVRGAVAPSLSPEYSFSREDLQAIRSVTPFQNAVGLSYFWNTLREDLPARSLEPQR